MIHVSCSICLFIQSQDFQRHTEHMLNMLYGGSRLAMEALANATLQLDNQVLSCVLHSAFLDPLLSPTHSSK